jgi:precorrin-2 dehydrogenase/sirohydrochlorin ferrochelatase
MALPVAWILDKKHVLIVGGGEVASQRIQSLLPTDVARISLVSPSTSSKVRNLVASDARILHIDRAFDDNDVTGSDPPDMVLTAVDDVDQSRHIVSLCRAQHIPINAADMPPECDFYFGSIIRRGPLQILVSTNGNGPKLANIIRTRIEAQLPDNVAGAIENVGLLRKRLRERAPGVGGELSKRRMRWMTDFCTVWQMDDLATLDASMMNQLLDKHWDNMSIPPPPSTSLRRRLHEFISTESLLPFASGIVIGASIAFAALRVRYR